MKALKNENGKMIWMETGMVQSHVEGREEVTTQKCVSPTTEINEEEVCKAIDYLRNEPTVGSSVMVNYSNPCLIT